MNKNDTNVVNSPILKIYTNGLPLKDVIEVTNKEIFFLNVYVVSLLENLFVIIGFCRNPASAQTPAINNSDSWYLISASL